MTDRKEAALNGLREFLLAQLDSPTFAFAPNDVIVKALRERIERWVAAVDAIAQEQAK